VNPNPPSAIMNAPDHSYRCNLRANETKAAGLAKWYPSLAWPLGDRGRVHARGKEEGQ